MRASSLVTLAASAAGVLAYTPPGFEPSSQTDLLVKYGSVAAVNGKVVAMNATQSAPSLATKTKLDGSSFVVIMIDLDIPTVNPPATDTLLHWMQQGLTQTSDATAQDTFALAVPSEPAYGYYIGPAPPNYIPLSHRYTFVLVDTSDATDDQLATLKASAATEDVRYGFNVTKTLTAAGLYDKVVAGNWFNVTNPGPAVPHPPAETTSKATPTAPAQGDAVPREINGLVMIAMAAVMFFAL